MDAWKTIEFGKAEEFKTSTKDKRTIFFLEDLKPALIDLIRKTYSIITTSKCPVDN